MCQEIKPIICLVASLIFYPNHVRNSKAKEKLQRSITLRDDVAMPNAYINYTYCTLLKLEPFLVRHDS